MLIANHSLTECGDSIAQQLRRRRQAALRLPPLPDRRRDPFEILVRYSREPLRSFWCELRDRGLVTDDITSELVRLSRGGSDERRAA